MLARLNNSILVHGKSVMRLIHKHKNALILSILCALLFFMFVIWRDEEVILNTTSASCFDRDSTGEGFQDMTQNSGNEIPSSRNDIFFHETSCSNEEGIVLNARQACAVESAAKHHPNRGVNLFFINPGKVANASIKLVQQLLSYPNVKIRRIKPVNYVKGTPLEEWYMGGNFKTSRWPNSHMSDILRYLTLWKFPGIYLDLDIVVLKSFDTLKSDFAGAEDWEDVAAGALGLSSSALGRKLASECVFDLKKNFNGNDWGNNGPGVITRVLQKLCSTTNAVDMKADRCGGFMVYDPSVFYPIFYRKWKQYFEEENNNSTMKMLQNASIIHVWNKFSKLEPVRVTSQVPYAMIARTHCPKVFANCGDIF